MAFNGVGGFSCGVCARAGTAVSDKIIGAINQLGNEFILIFLFRRAGLVQPHDLVFLGTRGELEARTRRHRMRQFAWSFEKGTGRGA